MRQEVVVKGKGLGGSSDLTLVASIKPGFVPALDAVTYRSRLKRLLKALHLGRASSHEYVLVRPLSDAVERIGRIHSVRVVVLEDENKLLLCATFDGSWEAYFRVLWQKTGRLLDAIYCNTEDYVTSWDHGYAEWLGWARRVQRETDFFYSVPSVTVDDQRLWRDNERHARRHDAAEAELANVRRALRSVEQLAQDVLSPGSEDGPMHGGGDGQIVGTGAAEREVVKQGFQSLVGLYALTDMFLPGTADGSYLQRAAVEFLGEMPDVFFTEFDDPATQRRFDRQVRWLIAAYAEPVPAAREMPELPRAAPLAFDIADVQGGVVAPYSTQTTHGALLLLAFDDAAAAASFLELMLNAAAPLITTAAGAGNIKRNLAFTMEGLRVCGLSEDELAQFPDEFRQGMAARAGQIGDVRTNHPRRWARPRRFGVSLDPVDDRVDLAAVHALVQLRTAVENADPISEYDITLPGHPLHDELERLTPKGTRILALESTRRQFSNGKVVEHFGWADGSADPNVDPTAHDARVNQVHLGELLLGYANEADNEAAAVQSPWLHNGSFLVVRKLRQFVDRLRAAVKRVKPVGLTEDEIYGKLMGRKRDGTPMIRGGVATNNNFSYQLDSKGEHCPFHAHIRRANPREMGPALPGRRRARLARRSMSYGRPFDEAPEEERGLLFLAYNSSIGEQFEVVQRWLAGGNSTGSTSAVADPLLGVPENGRRRYYRFETNGVVHRADLDGSDCLYGDPEPLVRLEWGLYGFAPSITALDRLAGRARASSASAPLPVWNMAQGEHTIQRLLALGTRDTAAAADAWKQVLEDIESVRTFGAAGVWAALRAKHGGVLRTPYGVLVATPEQVNEVLADHQHYSVEGYRERMLRSIGENHLGLDDVGPGCPYHLQSEAVNQAIRDLVADDAFELARSAAHQKLDSMVRDAIDKSNDFNDLRYEAGFDPREVIEDVLAVLCEAWFGLAEHRPASGAEFVRGGFRWDWRSDEAPSYPGHFGAPSRYIFQPRPGPEVVRWGIAHGMAVRDAARRFVQRLRRGGLVLRAPVGAAAMEAKDDDAAARALAGAVMGMVPTLDGALRRVLLEWTADGTLWAERARRGGRAFADHREANELDGAMIRALQLRPMPELIWRTVTKAHTLLASDGRAVPLQRGDVVVLAQVSVLQQALTLGGNELYPMFGGDRVPAKHPTHACPGYAAGMAAMRGVLAALVERPGGMRPGAAPPVLMLEGNSNVAAPIPACFASPVAPPELTLNNAASAAPFAMKSIEKHLGKTVAPVAAAGTLFGWGDSWMSYKPILIGRESNLMHSLKDSGYSPQPPTPYSETGMKVSSMAARPPNDAVYTMLDELLVGGLNPHAVLLSAGGNDCVKNALLQYVRDRSTGTTIDQPSWQAHLQTLRGHFAVILGNIKDIGKRNKQEVPVVLHGYDHPVVDGRYLFGVTGVNAWLFGWLVKQLHHDQATATIIMKELIDGLNGMLATLPGDPSLGRVVYVDLRGTLRETFGPGMNDAQWFDGEGYKKAWENELHPTPDGFKVLAAKLANALNAL